MRISLSLPNTEVTVELNAPFADLSMAVSDVARAWYIDAPKFEPVVLGDWTGSVAAGNGVNFFNVHFNPHAHGTHTETAGHISVERYSVNTHFKTPFALLAVLSPKVDEEKMHFADFKTAWDRAKTAGHLEGVTAVALHTDCSRDLPTREYSNTDWPYLDAEIGAFLKAQGIDHLLIDQPSVDKEEDGGALACHKSFWGPQPELSLHRTITELIHIPTHVKDGRYLLNLQVAPLENDAAPSRPLLYELL